MVVEDEARSSTRPRPRRRHHRLQHQDQPPRRRRARACAGRRGGGGPGAPGQSQNLNLNQSEPPKSPSQKSRARTPSPARARKGKKKRAKKEAAEVPVEATEQHLLTIVVGDDELGDDAQRGARRGRHECDEAAATADDDDVDGSRTGKAAARAARVRRRLRIVVCATVGDDNRATAALAAREPALFTSACVVRCGSDDAAARAHQARSMLTEWPEDAPQHAADLHTIAAKYVQATPGHFRVPADARRLYSDGGGDGAAPRSFE